KKRRDVLHYIRSKKASIICLQDTHFTSELAKTVDIEWGYKSFHSTFASNSRGTTILFNNNFEFKVLNHVEDTYGNYLILDIKIDDKRLTIANIYAPNKDSPEFFENLKENITNLGNECCIIVGDWNLLLDPKIDCINYKSINNPNARNKVLDIIGDLGLVDVWREYNPEKRMFTWKRKIENGNVQMGRLDFFLVSENLLDYRVNENILPGYRSDHSIITLDLRFKNIPKGKTFWKFNNSLLKDHDYVSLVRQTILDTKSKYAPTPYNQHKLDEIPNEIFHSVLNDQLFLEMLLLEIRGKTIAFSVHKKKQQNTKMKDLIKEIEELEEKTEGGVLTELEKKKTELENYRSKIVDGVLVRSKARWVKYGEKATRYFCNLENRHFQSKKMPIIINSTGEEVTDLHEISKEVASYYENLYRSREHIIDQTIDLSTVLEGTTPKLSDEAKAALEGEINLDEADAAVKSMKHNKSPGSDGFTVEFFQFFWEDIRVFWVRSINLGFKSRSLSSTQKEGLIITLPKGNKCRKSLKNWRPITLLNVSYKIASLCIANRIKQVLENIISRDQTGFMPNRFAGENIRLVYDILNFSKIVKKPGILLLIDFEKAFDSIAWSFLNKCLNWFNFGESIVGWINLFNKEVKVCTTVNNHPSRWFNIERGCRQGDPISPYLFLIAGEILGLMIRQNSNIKGYSIKGVEFKISQYADDTSLFLDGSKDSFDTCIEVLEDFSNYSGLKINVDKTNAIWFGCTRPPEDLPILNNKFNWNPTSFDLLGVTFTTDLKDITDNNILLKLGKITNDLIRWKKYNITPFGKITVIKTLILSQIVHILISLPNPSPQLIKQLETLFYNFLWNGKPDKIKRSLGSKKLENGGLGMVDLWHFTTALKITWIRRIMQGPDAPWVRFLGQFSPYLNVIQHLGPTALSKPNIPDKNPFWFEVSVALQKITQSAKIETKQDFKFCPILFNPNITINKQVISNPIFLRNGIFYIQQLF
ncbi:MAG: reverse transcriptase domain-containing protein, partial [Bacteroidota bacterium]